MDSWVERETPQKKKKKNWFEMISCRKQCEKENKKLLLL